jgi:hypothetical protein
MAEFRFHIGGWLIYKTPSSFDPCRFWLGDDRIGGTACVLGGLHHLVSRQGVVVRVLRRAGAEAEGEEEEGH